MALKNKHLLWPAAAVFKNLRTSTKLFILCGMFVGSIMLATYSLIDEKQIAISFVRKELVGAQYLEALLFIRSGGTPAVTCGELDISDFL